MARFAPPTSFKDEESPPYCCYNASVPVLAVCVDLDDVLLPPKRSQTTLEPVALMEWIHGFYVTVDSLLAEFPDLWRFSTMHCTFSLAPLLPLPSQDKADVLAAFAQRFLHTCAQVCCRERCGDHVGN